MKEPWIILYVRAYPLGILIDVVDSSCSIGPMKFANAHTGTVCSEIRHIKQYRYSSLLFFFNLPELIYRSQYTVTLTLNARRFRNGAYSSLKSNLKLIFCPFLSTFDVLLCNVTSVTSVIWPLVAL